MGQKINRKRAAKKRNRQLKYVAEQKAIAMNVINAMGIDLPALPFEFGIDVPALPRISASEQIKKILNICPAKPGDSIKIVFTDGEGTQEIFEECASELERYGYNNVVYGGCHDGSGYRIRIG